MFERRIEEATLNSWPALQQHLFDGWVIRFAQGYTKRANSVTPLYPGLLPTEDKIAYCEHFYQQKEQPTIFRLLSFSTESIRLDQRLAQRGYRILDRTHVWSLQRPANPLADQSSVHMLPLTDWFPIYRQFDAKYSELQHIHRELLERIQHPSIYATLYQHDVPVACGLGVLEHEALGLFDIVTDAQQRRKGYGTQLVAGMLDWGWQHGAQYAYLQVIETNQIAQRLYARLGFQPTYQYWYRRQER
ncbi:MAG TPA: GNAT family N-acetyltransferase [Ktedonobacteraceae bacterium]|nr:GNAT family N-acetyltransferase [Ktedonobacteraceae bacterium]